MLKQYLQFKLSQKLSPQQIQLMKLIQLPTQAFEQRINQELEENPALDTGKEETNEDKMDEFDNSEDDYNDNEEINTEDINIDEYLSDDDVPDYRTQVSNYSSDDEEKVMPYAAGTSFNQHLRNQLNTFRLDDEEREIAEFLVGSVDESGYIRRALSDIMDDLAFTQNIFTTEDKIENVLHKVHQLDPAGVGARGLQECLSIQLHRKEQHPDVELACNIIDKAFDQFTKKHYKNYFKNLTLLKYSLKMLLKKLSV